jgi:hypothetical protein
MSTSTLKDSVRNIVSNALAAVRRLPIPTLFSLLFCIVSISKFYGHKLEGTYLPILFCGYCWFIALKLFAESRAWPPVRYYTVGIVIFIIIAWHLYTSSQTSTPFSFLGTGLFLSIFVAPFLNKQASSMQLWIFNYRIWTNLCVTFLAAVVLFIGLIAIVASLNSLFGIKFNSTIYTYIWLVVATLFSPIFAMAGIPERFDASETNPKSIRIILSYIALPLLLIYAAILYGYTTKILITWNLPHGGVAYLVLAFCCTGIVAYLMSYPLHQEKGIINLFSHHFFKILLVPLALLAIGIILRVHEYGITEERYTVLLGLIWIAASALFTFIRPINQAPKFIFASLVSLLLAASIGPWSAVNLSTWSQVHRLKSLLEKHQVVVNNQIHHPTQALSRADRISISSIINYIIINKRTDYIKPWFNNLPNAQLYQKQAAYDTPTIMKDLGIEYIGPYSVVEEDVHRFRFYKEQPPYLEVSGYDYIINTGNYAIDQPDFAYNIKPDISIKLESSSNNYIVRFKANEPVVFPLEDVIKKLDDSHNPIIDKESRTLAIRLIINNISGEFHKYSKKPIITSIGTTLLIKQK